MAEKMGSQPEPISEQPEKSGLERAFDKYKADKAREEKFDTLSKGDQKTVRDWENPETRDFMVQKLSELRDAPEGSDRRILYEVSKRKLQELVSADLDAHIDDYREQRNAISAIDALGDAEEESF